MKPKDITPHPMTERSDEPGVCATCNVYDPHQRNARHHMPDVPEQDEHRRRIGDQL